MKPVAHEIFEIAKQRGFWLRCFWNAKSISCTISFEMDRLERARLQSCRTAANEFAALAAEGWF